MFSLCRYCGDQLFRARRAYEVCSKCEDSPLCDRCGHPRGDHTGVFVRGAGRGCGRVVGDFQSGTSWQCECGGFRPVVGALSDASFAAPDADPPTIPVLRISRD